MEMEMEMEMEMKDRRIRGTFGSELRIWWVNKWKKTQYRIQPHMDYNTATATNGLQTQVHKHMELEYKCINRYIWIWILRTFTGTYG
jgi:hypothetical protein